jgi:endonuclease/exonuclease/phosphatase family metal-dependent hydrolase
MRKSHNFRVVSYNIHQCIGRDGRCDPTRVAGVLQALNADVCGLQEVGACRSDSTTLQQLEYLAAMTNLFALAGTTWFRNDTLNYYGNALLTRWPVEHVQYYDLSVANREPRGALKAILQVREQRIAVIVTHLGLSAAERRQQVQRLLDCVCQDTVDATVLLGDFNEWWPWSRVQQQLTRYFGRMPRPRTFPAAWPILALDRICLTPTPMLHGVQTFHSPEAKWASDHLPLYGDFPI